jgi:hypothetical protein
MRDERGLVFVIGIVTLLGLALIGLAGLGYALRNEAFAASLWGWSWALFGAGVGLVCIRFQHYMVIIAAGLISAALWFFGVMGGTL